MVKAKTSDLSGNIKAAVGAKAKREPVWSGPCGDGPNGGVTQSLVSRFLVCRERFRLLVVEGLRPKDQFSHRIEYGNLWHVCEEALAEGSDMSVDNPLWLRRLSDYCKGLCKRYPTQQDQIDHWYNVCKVQFPLYVDFWSKHPDVLNRTPLLQEQVFDVPCQLPSGRTVRLRGKWDSVDLIEENNARIDPVKGPNKGMRRAGVWLQENKTKSDIDEGQLKRQLSFDLQTMLYLVALELADKDVKIPTLVEHQKLGIPKDVAGDKNQGVRTFLSHPIAGVRYNVIRRPLSGGKGSIVRHKPTSRNPQGESKEAYYGRLREIIAGASGQDWGVAPDENYFFRRWKVEILPGDIERFRRECLDPILEQLCAWWDWVNHCRDGEADLWIGPKGGQQELHWRHPFGTFNSMNEGGSSDLDEFLASGSEIGLQRCETLFGELS